MASTVDRPFTEIEMNDREDSVELSLQDSNLKACYWRDLTKEQKVIYILLIIILILILALIIIIIAFQRNINTIKSSSNNDCATTNHPSTSNICHYDTSSFIPSSTTNNLNITDQVNNVEITTPKNLIIMIGDGMGTIYNTAYREYKNQDRTILDSIFKGRYTTNPLNNTITDSAAGATAFSAGTRTFNGFIATDINGNPLGTILEALKRKGKGTGLIATKSVTDATPASFAAHTLSRQFHQLIAQQMTSLHKKYGWTNCSVIDIIMGGGGQYFNAWGFNESTYDEFGYGWNKYLSDNSTLYTLCEDDLPVIGLFADGNIPYYLDILNTENDYPSLLDMSRISIDLLNKTYYDEGFFMMIEGSNIDMCGHANDIACIMSEMEQFYDTVKYVTNWAEQDGDTLVVVLADHQTGGLAIGRQDSIIKAKIRNRLHGMAEEDIIEDYDDYTENPLILTDAEDGSAYSYKWYPESIRNVKHTSGWFANEILSYLNDTNSTMDIGQILDMIEGNWFSLSEQEKQFLNLTLVNGGRMDWALVHIVNIRTVTGFTTHGHTAVDVSLYAMGVSADSFVGHWRNNEIGQLLTRIMDCVDEQNQQTALLREMFMNDTLKLCDPTNKPEPVMVEYNDSLPYPWGNLKYPENCVDAWQ